MQNDPMRIDWKIVNTSPFAFEWINNPSHPDVYELVWRQFKNTLIHEIVTRFRVEDIFTSSWIHPIIHQGHPSHYYRPRVESALYNGFPIPERGGISRPWGNNTCARIFMDDLFMCPRCGDFHPVNRYWPDVPWLDDADFEINITALFKTIDKRRDALEFEPRPCMGDWCHEQELSILKQYKQKLRDDRKAERQELSTHEIRQISTPLPDLALTSHAIIGPCVYVIEARNFVKIGGASNVKNDSCLYRQAPHLR
jgi:hypothetical protein